MKINYNRPELTRSEIEKRQDFDSILKQIKSVKPYLFKKILFYGAIGLASITGIIIFNSNTYKTTKNKTYDSKITLNNTAITSKNETLLIKSDETVKSTRYVKNNSKIIKNEVVITSSIEKSDEIANEVKTDFYQKSNLPSISGVENGDISKEQFLNAKNIEIANSATILSFKVNYFKISDFIEKPIIGNVLTDDLKNEIISYHNQLPISITEIKALTYKDEVISLPSIRLFIK